MWDLDELKEEFKVVVIRAKMPDYELSEIYECSIEDAYEVNENSALSIIDRYSKESGLTFDQARDELQEYAF